MRCFLITILFFTLISCNKEYGYDIDPELEEYFMRFEDAGAERGLEIDLEAEGIGGIIDLIRDQTTVGQCQTSTEGNRRIFVDQSFWERYDDLEKEFIVFHELGHCYLGRDHDDSGDIDNNCISIMHSGLGRCNNNYNYSTRDIYLDELFSN